MFRQKPGLLAHATAMCAMLLAGRAGADEGTYAPLAAPEGFEPEDRWQRK